MLRTPAARIAVATACLLVIYAVAWATGRGRADLPVEMPRWKIDAIPLELGAWHGEAAKLDPRLFLAIGSVASRDIVYRNLAGQVVSLHCSVFGKEFSGLPHPPQLCYEGSGYRLASDRPVRVRSERDHSISARLLIWEREGQHVALLYWYQMGDRALTESSETAAARFAERKSGHRPALCKFMLQTPLDSPESAERRLTDLAGQVTDWLHQASRKNP